MSQRSSSRINERLTPRHERTVHFYESMEDLRTAVTRYLAEGFRNGSGMVVIATPEHRKEFFQCLQAEGLDLGAAVRSGQFKELDAREALQEFMDSDQPNPERFASVIGNAIENCRTGRESAPVLVYGEMVDVLWREGKCEAAIRVEELWNEFIENHPFEVVCTYSINGIYKGDHLPKFARICSTHSRVPTEHYMEADEDNRLLQISLLQQESFALRAEIQHRREIQKALLQALDDRRKAEEKLRRTEEQLRGILKNAAEGLHWVSPDGEILWANDAELNLLGYSAGEYIGHNIREFHVDAEIIEELLSRLAGGETLRNYEARLRAKDGSILDVLINSNVLWDEGEFVHNQCFTRDITDLKQAQQAQSYLSAIVESAEDAIVTKTLDGVITSWNPGAESLLGYSAKEVVGKPVTILIPTDQQNEETTILEKLRRGEPTANYETKRIRKDGKIIDVSVTVSPVRDARGRIIGASKVARDISRRKRLELERIYLLNQERAARAEAQAANRIKDEFLAFLSHELRTPLNAVLGWTSILETRTDEDLVARAIAVIKRNAEAQKRMIEDLLDLARILVGKLVIKTEQVDLPSAVNAALDSVAPAAKAKGIRLDRDFQDSIPAVTGDADRLQQVISNLVSNSMKFTPEGGYIQLRLAKTQSHVEISIRDSGKGIAPDLLPHVFDRFRQGESTKTQRHGGLGLGLAVVRHLVEAHGGTVNADSKGEGLGSTFTVRLPIRTSAHRPNH